MRIIAGKHRGRKLLDLKVEGARPTLDRVRENLFNIISKKVVGSYFLDLFTGSGAIGLEAISRGAKYVTLCDVNRKTIEHVEKNLKLMNEDAECVVGDYKYALKNNLFLYDIIYVDPPYAFDYEEILNEIIKRDALDSNGIIICEHDGTQKFSSKVYEVYDERKYGTVTLSFLRKKDE